MKRRWLWIIICFSLVVLIVVGAIVSKKKHSGLESGEVDSKQENKYVQQLRIENKCEGSGPVEFTHPPMKPEDVGIVLPYGLLAGGHVTPIDHMYFSPKDFDSKADTYPVYGIADGTIATIAFRADNTPSGQTNRSGKKGDYRLDIYYNCTFFSYYDLITSLSPELQAKVPSDTSKSWNEMVNIPIKAGQEIGKIGGQTLDWAVYNAETKLTGFVVAEHYDREPWKIYTDYKSLDYFIEPYKGQFYNLLARQVEPRIGKIDYDVDGKLVGNWFMEGTNGYAGASSSSQYWDGHLAIVPNYIDPTFWHLSIGNWRGEAKQFGIVPAQDPATVGIDTGIIKYELKQYEHYDPDNGQTWMSNTGPIKNPKGRVKGEAEGTVLLQLIESRKLKIETFPGKTASQVIGFTEKALNYVR